MSDLAREFIARSLAAAGGVVEDAPGGLEALLPTERARELDVPDELRIHLVSTEPAAGGHIVDGRIGSPFLERLVAARLERPALAAVVLPGGLPAPLPDDLPVLLNAVASGTPERRRTRGRFLAAELRVTLHGEEVRSALVSLTIRLADGALTEPFRVGGAYATTGVAPLDDQERRNAGAALRAWLRREAPAVHAGSLETLRRRARRDLERMAEYYAGLDAEMAQAARRARSDGERSRRAAKWAALPADLDQRREQLRIRIRPRLAASIVAATVVDSDVEHFVTPVRRRSKKGSVAITHRTGDGIFEGPTCAACGVATLRVYVCDERLHVLCDECGQAGRLDVSRCRACRGAVPEPISLRIEDPTAALSIGVAGDPPGDAAGGVPATGRRARGGGPADPPDEPGRGGQA